MAKYKVGDRVKVRSWDSMAKQFGVDSRGTIMVPCSFMLDMREFCGRTVTISRVISGTRWDAYRIKEDRYGWTFSNEMFEDPNAPKITKTSKMSKAHKPIVIYQEDRKVIAQDTQTGKTGVARCHPDDKFDFYYGAGLAIERLTGYKPDAESTTACKTKYYSGKVVCVENHSSFTIGKVYTIKNGSLYSDDGEHYESIKDIDWLNKHFNSQFIKFVE